jgi:hypothetical protein
MKERGGVSECRTISSQVASRTSRADVVTSGRVGRTAQARGA